MTDEDRPPNERRRHVRQAAPSTPVFVRDAHGRTWEGRVLDLSVGGVRLAAEVSTDEAVLEIRPLGSPAWVKVLVKSRRSYRSVQFLGCAFAFPPSREAFEALSRRSG